MSDGNNSLNKEVYEAERKMIDERFSRDSARLKELESMQKDVLLLSTQLAEILKYHKEQLKDHDTRIDAIEKRPASWVDRIAGGVVSAVIAALVAFMMTKIL